MTERGVSDTVRATHHVVPVAARGGAVSVGVARHAVRAAVLISDTVLTVATMHTITSIWRKVQNPQLRLYHYLPASCKNMGYETHKRRGLIIDVALTQR